MGAVGITKSLLQRRLAMARYGYNSTEIFVCGNVGRDDFPQMLQTICVKPFTHFYHCYTCKVMPGGGRIILGLLSKYQRGLSGKESEKPVYLSLMCVVTRSG
jgi:hypothetical protein